MRQPVRRDGRGEIVRQRPGRANYTFDSLCCDVEKMSTATEGDVKTVLITSLYCIVQAFRRSESLQFGDLGTFAVGLSSTGAAAEEEFTAANICPPPRRLPSGQAAQGHG